MKLEQIKKIGITGADTMDSGIEQIFARKGYRVVLTDVSKEFCKSLKNLSVYSYKIIPKLLLIFISSMGIYIRG